MPNFLQDLRFAARTSIKAPAASFVAILALAFGIGVNVSAFIAVDGILLHPLPFANLERIQTIWQTNAKMLSDRTRVSTADFLDLEKQTGSFEEVAAVRSQVVTLQRGVGSEAVRMAQVSPKFFSVLSSRAELGRILPVDPSAVVVSEAFWKTRLGGASDVLGRHISLSTGSATIVGVMPDEFDYPLGTDIWSPLILTPSETQQRSSHDLLLLGLLKPDVSAGQASLEASSIANRLATDYPATNADETFTVVPLRDLTEGITNRFVSVILGAAGFVLLLACANIGNLQLARATHRQKEMAVRAALGASRVQIARHLIAESLLLSTIAGCLGVLLADWNNFYTKQNIPAIAMRIVPGLRTMNVDPSVLAFALVVSVLAGVLCSFPAILHLSRRAAYSNLEESLRERSTLTSQYSSGLFRASLVVSELALALVLLIGAGLMVTTFHRLLDLNQGFDPKNVLTARISLPATAYGDSSRRLAYYDRALTDISRLPGAASAALAAFQSPTYFAIEGRPELRSGQPRPDIAAVSQSYLEVLRIPMLAGRAVTSSDTAQSSHAVVLSKSFARFYWPDSNPIGHRVRWEQGGEWFTVVGVSADVIQDWFSGRPSNVAYVSYAQSVPSFAQFVVRTQGPPMALATTLRSQLQAIDSAVPLSDLNSLEQALAEERSGVRAAARTMSSYAAIALLLAITGIYAVVSYLVSMRTRDIGVHIALGATRMHVLQMMTRQTGKLIVFGVAAGLLLSVLLTRVMAHVLFDVVQLDAPVWFLLTFVLLAAAFLAAYLPALRATKIDPMTALRHE
jgi:putative ABC transport system permease protein